MTTKHHQTPPPQALQIAMALDRSELEHLMTMLRIGMAAVASSATDRQWDSLARLDSRIRAHRVELHHAELQAQQSGTTQANQKEATL